MKILLVVGLLASACIATSPEEELRAAQGPYDDGDEEHRPGQPCLVCHGADYTPGDDVFVIAGTVYLNENDAGEVGTEGAEVRMRDSAGRAFVALTNTVGNFMVEVEPGLAAPRQRERGRLQIPWQPAFPLRVTVTRNGNEQEMESLIQREGSCAGCHDLMGPSPTHEGRVYLLEGGP